MNVGDIAQVILALAVALNAFNVYSLRRDFESLCAHLDVEPVERVK